MWDTPEELVIWAVSWLTLIGGAWIWAAHTRERRRRIQRNLREASEAMAKRVVPERMVLPDADRAAVVHSAIKGYFAEQDTRAAMGDELYEAFKRFETVKQQLKKGD